MSLAQPAIKKVRYKWKNEPSITEVESSLEKEDAYLVFRKEQAVHTYNTDRGFTPQSIRSVHCRVKVLSQKGIDENSNLKFRVHSSNDFTLVDARVIKKKGKPVKVNDEGIQIVKELNYGMSSSYWVAKINVPNVEIGDEIEYRYSYNSDRFAGINHRFFHSNLACLSSSFKLQVRAGLITKIQWHNGLSEPKKKTANQEMFEIFQWKLENLPAITNDAYSIWEDELPYVFYYLEKVYYNSNLPYWISEESWEGVINRYDWIFNDNGKTNGLKRWVEEEMVKFDGEDSFEKFRSFVHHVNGTYDIVQKLPDSEELLPLIDYIANRRIDEVNLTVLYDKLLKHLAIEYELVFARNRYEGEVDAMSISGGQFTNVGLRIQDNEGGFHYLFPSKRYSNWLLGEVPYYL